jgi:hypothetical protein
MKHIKTKIYGMGHEGRFTYIVVEKSKNFFDWLARLLYRSFKTFDVDSYDFENKKGQWVTRKKQIKNFVDKHESYYLIGRTERVDVFYGRNRVFIAVSASSKSKKKFLDVLDEISEWKK